jgi:hypothetical protein
MSWMHLGMTESQPNLLYFTSYRFSALESLELAARASPIASSDRRIVAVVGVGHMDGIENRFASIVTFLYAKLVTTNYMWVNRFGENSLSEIDEPH